VKTLIFRLGRKPWHLASFHPGTGTTPDHLGACQRFDSIYLKNGTLEVASSGRRDLATTRWATTEEIDRLVKQRRVCAICRTHRDSPGMFPPSYMTEKYAGLLGLNLTSSAIINTIQITKTTGACPVCGGISIHIFAVRVGCGQIAACHRCLQSALEVGMAAMPDSVVTVVPTIPIKEAKSG